MKSFIRGEVKSLLLSREYGKVVLFGLYHPLYPFEQRANHQFTVYFDDPPDITIDPTEMVKRNWLVRQLETGLRDQLTVTVMIAEFGDLLIQGVFLDRWPDYPFPDEYKELPE